jgi:hypothetical protein
VRGVVGLENSSSQPLSTNENTDVTFEQPRETLEHSGNAKYILELWNIKACGFDSICAL